jgi:hypothetical protein
MPEPSLIYVSSPPSRIPKLMPKARPTTMKGAITESMASLTLSRSSELDSRVQDYLDDKLQTPADFEGLDALLQQARNQQELLKKQVSELHSLV